MSFGSFTNRLRNRSIAAGIGCILFALLAVRPVRASDYQVIISEIHYHPVGAEPAALEFVELWNLGAEDADISGWSFTEGVGIVFPPGTLIGAGGFLIVSPDPDRARAFYGLAEVAGPYQGRLDNNGEVLALSNDEGVMITRLHFKDDGAWPSLPDGFGPSLEFTGRDNGNDLASRWEASAVIGGTPGAANSRRDGAPSSRVRGILNEVRAAGGGDAGFIELFNPTGALLSLDGFTISFGGAESFLLPSGTSLAPGTFRAVQGSSVGISVPSRDDVCLLLEPDGSTMVDALEIRNVPAGSSVGRHPDGDDDVFVMSGPTPGGPNVYSFTSPIVINEIHFHPPYVAPAGACVSNCSDAEQWIELWNRSGAQVGVTGWSLTKGVEYTIGAGVEIPAGEALVIAASVQAFRARHPGVANVVGGWSGRLSHASDTINLRDPLGNRVDHVNYGDGGPHNDEEPADGIDDETFRGSHWPSGADGDGRTLELLNPDLDNAGGLAWRASSAVGGTPGAVNSVLDAAPDPVVHSVRHVPPVPRSTEAVTVRCTISAIPALASATLEWAPDGEAFRAVALRDDGVGVDDAAGDGVHAGSIPARADGQVVVFRIIARDSGGRSVTVPLQPGVAPYSGFEGPYYLYEVDNDPGPAVGLPIYRIVMRARDLQELEDRDRMSDVLLPGTFIAGDEVRHLVGVRYRGETSRREPNRSYRIELPSEDAFEEIDDLNLNGSNGGQLGGSNVRDILSADLFRRAGAPYAQMSPVVLHFPGEVAGDFDTRYARKENYDQEFLSRYFGGSDRGNLYRGLNPEGFGSPNADLAYLGPDPEPYRDLYEKRSNEEADDYSDIIALTRALDPTLTPDGVFADTLEGLIDSVEWAQFFALNDLLSNQDGGIWNNNGEDYFLYRVPPGSTRPDAGKFLLLPWDMEETFGDAGERLFRQQLPTVRRFLTHPRFANHYYAQLRYLREGPFSRFEMRTRFQFVSGMFPAADVFNIVDPIDSFLTSRIGYIDQNIPDRLTVGPANGSPQGTEVISPGETWMYFRGTEDPPGAPGQWTQRGYPDDSWELGATGIGYGDGDDQTTLTDMENGYLTVFARKTFQIADPSRVAALTLVMSYDDAFVAYVNGAEVARSPNAPRSPGDIVFFDDNATSTHEIGEDEAFDLPVGLAGLVAGTNVLAIVGFNERINSSDFSLVPTLLVGETTQGSAIAGGCGGPIFATGTEVVLEGVADPAIARSVTVDGALAASSYVTSGPGPYGLSWTATVPVAPGQSTIVIRTHSGDSGQGSVTGSTDVIVQRLSRPFTQVGGLLAASTTWTEAGGPYRLMSRVVVPPGVTLTVQAGAVVLANDGVGILVGGRFVADGTESSPILFGAFECDRPWAGIVFQDTGIGAGAPGSTLRGSIIQHGTNSPGAGGVIAPNNSKLLVEGCRFQFLEENAIDAVDARLEVRDSIFEKIYEGVHGTRSTVIILDSVFRSMIGDNDAIDFDFDMSERSQIGRCLFETSADDGIDLALTSVDIHDNFFIGVADKAISLEGNGALGPPTLARNIITGCGTGIALKDGVNVIDAQHNTITGCQEGLNLFARDAGPQGGHGIFHSSIVWSNIADVKLDDRSTISFSFSDVGGDSVWPGAGNINAPPRFVAPESGDFSLSPGSPCIGSGMDGTDMGAIPFTGTAGFIRGDTDLSGGVDISDPIATLNYLFAGAGGPSCEDILDGDDDGRVDITDPVFILRHLFQGGPVIPPPYPEAGPDPTADELSC